MKMTYYPETDSLFIELTSKPSTDSKEISEGIVLDYDQSGDLIGLDIDNASKKLDLQELTLDHLPIQKYSMLNASA